MPKRIKDDIDASYAAHRKRIEEFDSQPTPIAYCCFIWPHLSRWQAAVAYEVHKKYIPAVRDQLQRVRREVGDEQYPDHSLLGDAVSVVAEMVLRQMDDESRMGGLLAFMAEHMENIFMTAVVTRDANKAGVPGSLTNLQVMPADVTTVDEARAYCDNHPLIMAAKKKILESLAEGPKH